MNVVPGVRPERPDGGRPIVAPLIPQLGCKGQPRAIFVRFLADRGGSRGQAMCVSRPVQAEIDSYSGISSVRTKPVGDFGSPAGSGGPLRNQESSGGRDKAAAE